MRHTPRTRSLLLLLITGLLFGGCADTHQPTGSGEGEGEGEGAEGEGAEGEGAEGEGAEGEGAEGEGAEGEGAEGEGAEGEGAEGEGAEGEGQVGCGDGQCLAPESSTSCPLDCPPEADCGNGDCEPHESAVSCPADCASRPRCGDGECTGDETPASCATDCGSCAERCEGDRTVHYCGEEGADLTLDCPADLGSGCRIFDQTAWCDCGSLAEGAGRCLPGWLPGVDLVFCEGGSLALYYCLAGAYCDEDAELGAGCFCDDLADGICPDPGCTNDVDCGGCTPRCDGRQCGDNGCGGSCGDCGLHQECDEATGRCQDRCVPDCEGKQCGPDGCGRTCGAGCAGTETCTDGRCVCQPQCAPVGVRHCGADGCGGDCGSCPDGYYCSNEDDPVRFSGCHCQDAPIRLTFDPSPVDLGRGSDQVYGVEIELKQIYRDIPRLYREVHEFIDHDDGPWSVELNRWSTMDCAGDTLEVERLYVFGDGRQTPCDAVDTLPAASATVFIPPLPAGCLPDQPCACAPFTF